METMLKLVCLAGLSAVWLGATGATALAQVQPDAQNAATPAAPAPSVGASPSSAAPGYQPPPAYYPPPGYARSPGYYPPPGYAPPPGYYPPPGYTPYYSQQALVLPPGHHLHDGFYMRLTMGLGILNAKYSQNGQDTTISGGGLAMAFALGGAVTPNLILFGEVIVTGAMDASQDNNDTYQQYGENVTLLGIGPGVAYYLEPSNIYFSGTLAFSQVSASRVTSSSDSNDSADLTDLGVGASFMFGKEWWVSHDWGLGVAGLVHLASMKMKYVDSRMTATAISVLFSATFN